MFVTIIWCLVVAAVVGYLSYDAGLATGFIQGRALARPVTPAPAVKAVQVKITGTRPVAAPAPARKSSKGKKKNGKR